MRRSAKLIAGQVVVSALALAFIYVTLLSPGDDNPLFGVEAPNEATPTNPAENGKPAGERKANGGQGGGTGGDGGAGGSQIFAPGASTFAPGPSLAPDGLPPDTGRDGSTDDRPADDRPTDDRPADDRPADDQYRNTLTEIRQRLAAG